MRTYRLAVIDSAGGKECIHTVQADSVEKDSHWVTFYVAEQKEDVFQNNCDNCGRGAVRPRMVAQGRHVVAMFPANRVRSVMAQ